MESKEPDPAERIDDWLRHTTDQLSDDQCWEFFDKVFTTLTRRATPLLGEVVLGAILERALYTSSQRFPVLLSFKLGTAGLSSNEPAENVSSVKGRKLIRPLGSVLIEFYSIVYRLTGELLTSALFEELTKLSSAQISSSESTEKL